MGQRRATAQIGVLTLVMFPELGNDDIGDEEIQDRQCESKTQPARNAAVCHWSGFEIMSWRSSRAKPRVQSSTILPVNLGFSICNGTLALLRVPLVSH